MVEVVLEVAVFVVTKYWDKDCFQSIFFFFGGELFSEVTIIEGSSVGLGRHFIGGRWAGYGFSGRFIYLDFVQ